MSEREASVMPVWMNQILIRQVQKDDLPLLEWDGEYSHFRQIYLDSYRRALRGLSVLWVAELQPIGLVGQVFIQLQCDRPELCNGIDRAYLFGFRVRPAYRGSGLGSAMMRALERDLIERGYRFLTLNVARENQDAIRLYQRVGFRIVAPEPGRWQYVDDKGVTRDVHEPAWRMEKMLDAG